MSLLRILGQVRLGDVRLHPVGHPHRVRADGVGDGAVDEDWPVPGHRRRRLQRRVPVRGRGAQPPLHPLQAVAGSRSQGHQTQRGSGHWAGPTRHVGTPLCAGKTPHNPYFSAIGTLNVPMAEKCTTFMFRKSFAFKYFWSMSTG